MYGLSDSDFERLELLFRRSGSLPELPGTAMRLISAIDSDEASVSDIERIIVADTALSSNILRISNTGVESINHQPVTTVKGAVLRLGQRSVRNLAVSLLIQQVAHPRLVIPEFKASLFSRHSLMVAFLSRYIHARRNMIKPFESRWSSDEIFAAALLHDLGIALLARVEPEIFRRVLLFAERSGRTIDHSFRKIYGQSIGALACAAAEAWKLPDLFAETLRYASEPWSRASEYTSLSCLNYANYLACNKGVTIEEWPVTVVAEADVEEEIGLTQEELNSAFDTMQQLVERYIQQEVTPAPTSVYRKA